MLPGTSVVTLQVREFLELRVTVGREQFAVSEDVDSLSFGLLQDVVKIVDVVTGNKDGLTKKGKFDFKEIVRTQ